MLICFTSASALGYACFRNQEKKPFSLKWWTALICTGAAIGCVSSVKWVGFLVTALVGLMTIEELWTMLGDVKMPKTRFLKHFFARVLGLIVVPISIYMASFYVHFAILNRSGPGDANMSSLFQASLEGSPLQSSPVDVVFGSQVTLKSNAFGGGLLHSHVQTYPSGSKQQQVTTYHHKDENNSFFIVRAKDPKNELEKIELDNSLEHVNDGMIVRLRHVRTGRHLHSHQVPAPVTPGEFEVSAYGQAGLADPNDLWEVQVVKGPESDGKRQLKTLMSSFRLKHVPTGCYLKARNVQLPEWGFRQGEVSCERTITAPSARSYLWNIETNQHEKLEPGKPGQYKARFLDNFRDCNVGMYLTNNALKPDPELEPSPLTSTPGDWFLFSRGIRMASWDAEKLKFYMLGNPAVWPTSSLVIIALIGLMGIFTLIRQRKAYNLLPSNWSYFTYQMKMAVGGWALHFFPFFSQGRVLYLHHYYPALLFVILSSGLLFDLSLRRFPESIQRTAFAVCFVAVLGLFVYFSPMCYGISGPAEAFAAGRQWISSWNLADKHHTILLKQ